MPRVLLLSAWGLVVVIVLCLLPVPAAAGGVVGTGLGTCNEAALDAALAGGGLVTFNCGGVPAVITLSTEKVITQDTTVDGAGQITLSGNGLTRIFKVQSGASLSLSNLGLTRGEGSDGSGGGAIANTGRLTLNNVNLYDNHTPYLGGAIYAFPGSEITITNSLLTNNVGDANAGAIENDGRLHLVNTDFTGNRSGQNGGAILSGNGSLLSIRGGTFFSNTGPLFGGALYVQNSSATMSGTQVLTNTAGTAGGGLALIGGAMTITASLLQGNLALTDGGGGVYDAADLLLDGVTLTGNRAVLGGGGGVYTIKFPWLMSLVVLSSTLANNTALDGGGLWTDWNATLINSTLSGNTVQRDGAGAYASYGTTQLYNTTIAGNQVRVPITATDPGLGGGLYITGSASVLAENMLLALNGSGPANGQPAPDDCYGPLQSLGHNLILTTTNCSLSGLLTGNVTGHDPLLAALAGNGGPAPTRALLRGSPAINAGDSTGCPPVDQRGVARLGVCDIGAFEFDTRFLFLPLVRR